MGEWVGHQLFIGGDTKFEAMISVFLREIHYVYFDTWRKAAESVSLRASMQNCNRPVVC